MGEQDSIGLGVAEDLWLTLPRDAFDNLNKQLEINDYIKAPTRIGQELGRSVLTTDKQVLAEVPLLALQKVREGGIFLRMRHSIMRLFSIAALSAGWRQVPFVNYRC